MATKMSVVTVFPAEISGDRSHQEELSCTEKNEFSCSHLVVTELRKCTDQCETCPCETSCSCALQAATQFKNVLLAETGPLSSDCVACRVREVCVRGEILGSN